MRLKRHSVTPDFDEAVGSLLLFAAAFVMVFTIGVMM